MAAERRGSPSVSVVIYDDRPLLGVIETENGREVTRYFTEDSTSVDTSRDDIEAALSAIGAWSNLDWDEMEAALDRIRHESNPTPPIDL